MKNGVAAFFFPPTQLQKCDCQHFFFHRNFLSKSKAVLLIELTIFLTITYIFSQKKSFISLLQNRYSFLYYVFQHDINLMILLMRNDNEPLSRKELSEFRDILPSAFQAVLKTNPLREKIQNFHTELQNRVNEKNNKFKVSDLVSLLCPPHVFISFVSLINSCCRNIMSHLHILIASTQIWWRKSAVQIFWKIRWKWLLNLNIINGLFANRIIRWDKWCKANNIHWDSYRIAHLSV